MRLAHHNHWSRLCSPWASPCPFGPWLPWSCRTFRRRPSSPSRCPGPCPCHPCLAFLGRTCHRPCHHPCRPYRPSHCSCHPCCSCCSSPCRLCLCGPSPCCPWHPCCPCHPSQCPFPAFSQRRRSAAAGAARPFETTWMYLTWLWTSDAECMWLKLHGPVQATSMRSTEPQSLQSNFK